MDKSINALNHVVQKAHRANQGSFFIDLMRLSALSRF